MTTETEMRPPTRAELQNLGSLITFDRDGQTHCLGDLWATKEHGVFDPDVGRVDVTPAEAKAHNAAYDKARIEGLDNQCQVGQGGGFYVHNQPPAVRTFSGTDVAVGDAVRRRGKVYTMQRGERTFIGRRRRDDDFVFFERVH